MIKHEIIDVIAFEQMIIKYYYDEKYIFYVLNEKNWIFLKLHKKYNISLTNVLKKNCRSNLSNFFEF